MLLAMSCLAAVLVSPHVLPPIMEAKMWAVETLGWTQYRCLDAIVRHESGWRVTARNRTSGSYGLGQALPASKMARFGADYLTNSTVQLHWMIAYMNGRYGSACKALDFWRTARWY